MTELNDYSGDFRPDFSPQDFSKDALTQMWKTASSMYLKMDSIWFFMVARKFGEAAAWELEHELWSRAAVAECRKCSEAFNIHGDDVATCFKVLQIAPGFTGIADCEFELKDKTHGFVTFKQCPALDHFERYDPERIKTVCHGLELGAFDDYAHYFNPAMKTTPVVLPPRKSRDAIACRWEFRIEE